MKILLVGGGKVGRTLISQLAKENHDITVVDTSHTVVRDIVRIYDVIGIVGNGTSHETLEEADIAHTDVLIAVTDMDEVNLLCCVIAKQKHDCHTIARVRNPVYSKERHFLRSELELSMTINPELEAAREIARLLQFPNAIEIDSFAKDAVDLLRFKVANDSPLIGTALKDISQKIAHNILVCIAEKNDKIIIPDGSYVIEQGATLSIIAMPGEAEKFFRRIGVRTNKVKDTLIVGGGGITYYLTEILLRMDVDVKIIEQKQKRCEELAEMFPEAVVDRGDGSDQELLNEEHLEEMDSLVACTGIDEVNAILSLYAQQKVRTKVITKLNHLEYNEVIRALDLDTIVNPKLLTAQRILQYVRGMHNGMGSNVETLYRLMDGQVEALEFMVQPGSDMTNIRLADMHLKKNVLIAGILRNFRLIIPGGQDRFLEGDSVIVVTTNIGFGDIHDILA